MADETIHIIMTGGTIDSYYDGSKDTVVPNKTSVIPKYVNGLKLRQKFIFTEVVMKDSRELNRKDMDKILDTVERSKEKNILITHGTYTMPDTGRYLKAHMKSKNKKVILTASFIPIDGFTYSDGPFNLGFSIASFNNIDNGVFVCINGGIYDPEEVFKLISEGRYDTIYSKK